MDEIVKAQSSTIIRSMDDAERAARAMAQSGFFADSKSASQAVVKILAGQELGFGPFASMTGVNIIQNKPVLAANLLAAAVKRTGKYNYRVTIQTEKECTLTWFEGAQQVGASTFTMDEAIRAGLSTKDNWKKYPSDMLFARALSRGQKRYAPDIFNGATVYTPDELGAVVDENGAVVTTPTALSADNQTGEITSEKPAKSLQGVKSASEKSNDTRVWSTAQKQALIDAHLADNDFSAKGMLGLSCLQENADAETIVEWGTIYRNYREETDDAGKKIHLAPEAADFANDLYGGKE